MRGRVHLGQQVEQLGNHDLVDRIYELTEENLRLSTAERQATTENTQLRQRVAELEDDLTAARTSLRRMIRNENRT
jgi:predicted nuclease with TOPRIM domain